MALELQLNTAKAAASLQKATQAVDKFGASLQKLGQAAGAAGSIAKSLASIKGVNPQVISGVERLSKALAQLKSVGTIKGVADSLNKLGNVNVGKVVSAVKALSAALARIRIPPGLQSTIKMLQQIAPIAQKASTSVRQFAASLARVRPPSGLNAISAQLKTISSQARQTSTSLKGMGSATSSVTGLLAGFGIALGGVGIAQFIKGAFEATRTIDGFKSAMTAFRKEGVDATVELERLAKTADRLGLALEPSITGFKKFSAATLSAGVDLKTTIRTFENFQVVAAALKLSGDQISRVFLALEQTFSKGRVASEELRRQLGEVIPGAFQAAAQAANMTGAEFSKALQKGQIPAELMIKLGQELADKYREASEVASKTFIAAVTRMTNSVFKMQEAFGRGFGDAAKDSVNALAQAMDSPAFLGFAQNLGTIFGAITSVIAQAAKLAVTFPKVAASIGLIIGMGLAGTILKWVVILSGLGPLLFTLVKGFRAVAAAVAVWGGIQGIILAVGAGLRAMAVSMAVLGAGTLGTVVAITAAGIAIGALIAVLTRNISAEEALAKITEGLGKAWDFAKNTADVFLGGLDSIKGTSNEVAGSMTKTATATKKTAAGFEETAEQSNRAAQGLGQIEQAASRSATSMGQAGAAASSLASGTAKVGSASSSASGSLSRASNAASQVARAYRDAAAAARELAQAQARLRAGGGGGGAAGQSGGGYAGIGPNVPIKDMSIFKNAPRLATGTANTSDLGGAGSAPTGGIPAVLHPNEAVVPLAGGGTIPVAMSVSGGGGGGAASPSGAVASQETLRILELLSDINLEMGKNTTVTHVLATQYVEMTRISHDWYAQIVNKLTGLSAIFEVGFGSMMDAFTSLETAIGSISSGGGGFGGGGGSFQGNLGDFQNAASLQDQSNAARESLRGAQKFETGTGGNATSIFTSPQDRATDERSSLLRFEAQGALHRAFQNAPGVKIKTQGGRSTYTVPADLFDQLPLSIRNMPNVKRVGGGFVKPSALASLGISASIGSSGSFAHGTANTSDSGMFRRSGGAAGAGGGATAVLHPNEAVIPLDGNRKVPVTLTQPKGASPSVGGQGTPGPGFLEKMGQEERRMAQKATSLISGRSAQRGDGAGGGGNGLNVFMKVVCSDANSFLENKDQIIQTLASKLNRVKTQFGQKSISGDPTSFLRKKDREGV